MAKRKSKAPEPGRRAPTPEAVAGEARKDVGGEAIEPARAEAPTPELGRSPISALPDPYTLETIPLTADVGGAADATRPSSSAQYDWWRGGANAILGQRRSRAQ